MDLLRENDFERRTASWKELFATVGRHKLLIAVVFALTVLGAYAVLELIAEQYETKSSLLVKLGRENSEMPVTVLKGNYLTTGVRKEELNSEVQMLTSRRLVERVVDELGPQAFKFEPQPPQTFVQAVKYHVKRSWRWTKDRAQDALIAVNLKKRLNDREQAILAVEDALGVETEKDSDVVGIRVRLPHPALCVQVAETILRLYFESRAELRQNDAARDFFDEETLAHRQELQNLEQAKTDARGKWNISAVPDQRSLLLKRLSEINEQITANVGEIAMLRKQQSSMVERLNGIPDVVRKSEVVTNNPSIQSIKDRLTTLEVERAKLANRYQASSQVVKNTDEEIASLRELLKKEELTMVGSVTSEVNPLKQNFSQSIEEIGVKIGGLAAKTNELRVPAAAITRQLRQLNVGEDELARIEREQQIAEQNYLTYQKRREEARISEELDSRNVANVVVLSPPTAPIIPIYPRKLLIMGVALPVGLLLSVALAMLLDFLSDKIKSPTDLADIDGLPSLGTFRLEPAT